MTRPNRLISGLTLALACLFATSCVDSKNPVGQPRDGTVHDADEEDSKIGGVWRRKAENALEYIHVGPARGPLPRGVMRAVVINHGLGGAVQQPFETLVFSTTIGKNHYLNIAMIDPSNLKHFTQAGWKPEFVADYLIVKYELQGDSLLIWHMAPESKRRVITAGKIKGTLQQGAPFFTDTTENMVALLSSDASVDLFEKTPKKYDRIDGELFKRLEPKK